VKSMASQSVTEVQNVGILVRLAEHSSTYLSDFISEICYPIYRVHFSHSSGQRHFVQT
jgi:hypothetical protein